MFEHKPSATVQFIFKGTLFRTTPCPKGVLFFVVDVPWLQIVRSTSGAVTVILVILHGLVFLQDLSFPLSPTVDGGFVWGDSPYVSIFSQALAYLSLGATASISSSIQGLVLVLSIIWVVLYILLFGWSLVALGAEGSSKATWLTRIFSFMTALSRTIFFIPCVGGLLSILTCYSSTTGPSLDSKVFSDTLSPWSFNSWSITSLGCFEGGHVALVVLFSLVAFAFVTVVFIMELIVADRTPVYHRQHLFRKVSSRSEAFILLGRFLLCLIFALRPYLHAGVLLGFSVLQHVFMLSALLHVLPYYAPFTNRLFTTFAAMLGWGSLSSIFSLIVNMPSVMPPVYPCSPRFGLITLLTERVSSLRVVFWTANRGLRRIHCMLSEVSVF